MRNSIVLLVVVLSALLITPITNARDVSGDSPSVGLCCFQGPKDWPKLDGVTNHRSEIEVVLLDIDALGLRLAPRADVDAHVHLRTILALAAHRTTPAVSVPPFYYASPAANIDFDSIRLNFAYKPLDLGISMENSAERTFVGIISAPFSYASAASNAN